jgi:hypothetical protein
MVKQVSLRSRNQRYNSVNITLDNNLKWIQLAAVFEVRMTAKGVVIKMICIVGTNHRFQHINADAGKVKKSAVSKFRERLRYLVESHSINVIAEEFSVEALRISNASLSVCQEIAQQNGICHVFCDPTSDERSEHGIYKHDDAKREMFWLQRLQPCIGKKVLFICGSNHTESFCRMIRANQVDARIDEIYWGEDLVEDCEAEEISQIFSF